MGWGLIALDAVALSAIAGIECVRSMLKPHKLTGKPRLYIHPRCKHLIEELRKYRWLKSKKAIEGSLLNPKVARPEPLKRDDDSVDALRYLIYTDQVSRDATIGSMRSKAKAGRGSSRWRAVSGPPI